jgi:thioredoxin reductase (NADPH)
MAGSVEALLPGLHGESLVTLYSPGDFSGELSTLRGVAGFARLRVREDGEVLAIDERKLQDVVQTDADLSELMMRAFILRRVGLLSSGEGEVMLLGSRHSAGTLRLREFLTRNAYPYVSVDLDGDAEVQGLLDRFHVGVEDVPVVIGHCGRVFRNPSICEIAEDLQMNPAISESKVFDVVVVGAGPAGLAAAVYAASEGLDVMVVEAVAPGG